MFKSFPRSFSIFFFTRRRFCCSTTVAPIAAEDKQEERALFSSLREEFDLGSCRITDGDVTRPVNRYRKIIYNEGELENSDLTRPPSRQNPHPFDPDTLPPTHSLSLTEYVNHVPVLQRLLDLGMDLFDVELNGAPQLCRRLVRLDLDEEVSPRVGWLLNRVGFDPSEIGTYLTRNPYFLLQSVIEMESRLSYLKSKGFSRDQIRHIVITNRFWLNMDSKVIDARLGYIQRQFRLRGNQVRHVIVKEPRVLAFGLGPLQRIVLHLNRDCGFSPAETRHLLLEDPRIFMGDAVALLRTHRYLSLTMHLTNKQILQFPMALRIQVHALRPRHEYLVRLGKANYSDNEGFDDAQRGAKESCSPHVHELGGAQTSPSIPLCNAFHASDRVFAEEVAGTELADYHRFLKYL